MSYFKSVLKGTLAAVVQTRNVFYFDGTTEGDQYIPADVEAYMSALFDPIQELISIVWVAHEIETFKWVAAQWEHFNVQPFPLSGGDSEHDVLPNQMAAVLIGITTGLKIRGRKAIAGFVESSCIAGLLTAGALIQLALSLSVYISHFHGSTGDVIPGTWSRSTSTFRPFIGGTASAILGTMRRRKPGVGI